MEAVGIAPTSAEPAAMRLRVFPSESDLGLRLGRSAGHVAGAMPSYECPRPIEGVTGWVSPLLKPLTRDAGFPERLPQTAS